jgi:hypothetical protein
MKNFNLAFIYKITNGVLDYYGSSADTYEQRKRNHMTSSNHCTSKKIINSGLPWKMDIIEWFPCSCVEELEDLEAWYIMNNECVNEYVPGAVRRAGGVKAYKKQYRANNVDKIKQYRDENAEAENARRNVKHNCDVCGGKYTMRNKSKHNKTEKHQKAIAEAVATHAPPQPQTINNTINCQVCNITQQK